MADQGVGAQTKSVPTVNTGGTDLGKTQNKNLLDLSARGTTIHLIEIGTRRIADPRQVG